MKITYELSISELNAIIELILRGFKESEAFEKILAKRHFVK